MFKKSAFALVRRFFPFVRPHMRYVWAMLACLILSTPLSVVSPLIIKSVIDGVTDAESRDRVFRLGGFLIGMTLLSVLLGIANGWCTKIFHVKVVRDLQMRLFRHVQGLSLRFFRDRETGQLMSRLTDDIGSLNGVMADAFGRAGIDLLRAVAYVVMLFYVEWRMALGGLLLAAIVFGFEYVISPRLRELSKAVRDRWTELTETLHQGVSGHDLIQSSAAEKRETKRYARSVHKSDRANMKRFLFSLWTDHFFHLIAGVAPTIIILAGVYLIATQDFTVGGLFAFFMYLVQMFGAVSGIAALNPAMQQSLAALERIYEILDTEPEVKSPPNGARPPKFEGAVRFENVSFGYDSARPVLNAIEFDVPPKTMVALVGPSGAGKTTLVSLLPRFFDPQSGTIRIDGYDLKDLELRNYRRSLGIVPQEIFLFDRSVAENIAYGRPRATEAEIRRAAEAANAVDFIEKLDKGFQTIIGERGVRLSGGQRQRLAIARELLRDPSILILDEATSSLDSESESLIQEALGKLLLGRTSFVIAHRLSTILRADLILVLDEGRIVERGRHTELLEKSGLYARLFDSQFKRPLENRS